MEAVYRSGIHACAFVQSILPEYLGIFLAETTRFLGSPEPLLFPLVALLYNEKFVRKLIVTVSALDFLGGILKWVLRGDRPIWWVAEQRADFGKDWTIPNLRQYPETCEASPGTPSSRVMMFSAIGALIVFETINKRTGRALLRDLLVLLVKFGFWTLLGLICISRLFVASQFPHQMFIGFAIGVTGSWLLFQIPFDHAQPRFFYLAAAFFTSCTYFAYFLLSYIGLHPKDSIAVALTHCIEPSWVNKSTQPLHVSFRTAGLMLGSGFSSCSLLAESSCDVNGKKHKIQSLTNYAGCWAGLVLGKLLLVVFGIQNDFVVQIWTFAESFCAVCLSFGVPTILSVSTENVKRKISQKYKPRRHA